MFLISLSYIVDLATVDAHLEAHVAWLEGGLADGWLLVAARKVPRDGGILILQAATIADARALAATDPFVLHGVATMDVTQFALGMVAPGLERLKS